MIILTNTATDKLRLITSGAATVDTLISWVDNASGTITAGRTATAITTATTTDIVATPAASTVRNVKTIHIYNKDAATPTNVTVVYDVNGTAFQLWKTLLRPGESLQYIEGIGFFLLTDNTANQLLKVLSADDTGGQAVSTVQPWFPTAGAVTVPATTTYAIEGLLKLTHGATSHSTGISFGGTATLTSIGYYAECHRSAADTLTATFAGVNVISASNVTVDVAGTAAATYIKIVGILRTNAAGTLIPNFTFSANPTGTITVKKDSYFRLQALGANSLTTLGTWA